MTSISCNLIWKTGFPLSLALGFGAGGLDFTSGDLAAGFGGFTCGVGAGAFFFGLAAWKERKWNGERIEERLNNYNLLRK